MTGDNEVATVMMRKLDNEDEGLRKKEGLSVEGARHSWVDVRLDWRVLKGETASGCGYLSKVGV